MVFHNVVPTVVTQLEGDREKITKALIGGTTVPFLMFLAWNGIILGNIINEPGALDSGLDPIAFLQSQGIGGESLGVAVSTFSELAIITSFIGFIYGLLDALTDAFKLPLQGLSSRSGNQHFTLAFSHLLCYFHLEIQIFSSMHSTMVVPSV